MGKDDREDGPKHEDLAPGQTPVKDEPLVQLDKNCSEDVGSEKDYEHVAEVVSGEVREVVKLLFDLERRENGNDQKQGSKEVEGKGDNEHDVVGEAELLFVGVNRVGGEEALEGLGREVVAVEAENVAPVGDGLEVDGYLLVVKEGEIPQLDQSR